MNAFKNTVIVLLILALGFFIYLYSNQAKELTIANAAIAAKDQQIAENDRTITNQNAQLMRLTSNPGVGAITNVNQPASGAATNASGTATATGTPAASGSATAGTGLTGSTNVAALAAAQQQAIKDSTSYDAAVQKLIKLPPNEGLPNFATIKDADGLKKIYPFFKDAQNGDLTLIYKDQMVIYRKAANKVINFKLISEATIMSKAN